MADAALDIIAACIRLRLEFSLLERRLTPTWSSTFWMRTKREKFAAKIADIREPRTTTGGVNFVIGFRPELWSGLVPGDMPTGVEGFNKEIQGVEGFVMPSTQHDALVWMSGSAYDVIFDMARAVVRDMAGLATRGRGNFKLALQARSRPYGIRRWLGESDAAGCAGGCADTGG